jgi:hypothetical protein
MKGTCCDTHDIPRRRGNIGQRRAILGYASPFENRAIGPQGYRMLRAGSYGDRNNIRGLGRDRGNTAENPSPQERIAIAANS